MNETKPETKTTWQTPKLTPIDIKGGHTTFFEDTSGPLSRS